MKIDILSLFPEFVQAFFDQSIIKRALDAGRMEMAVTNPRDYTMYRHRQVDDTNYGGGARGLMMCQSGCFFFAGRRGIAGRGNGLKRGSTWQASRGHIRQPISKGGSLCG